MVRTTFVILPGIGGEVFCENGTWVWQVFVLGEVKGEGNSYSPTEAMKKATEYGKNLVGSGPLSNYYSWLQPCSRNEGIVRHGPRS